MQKRGKTKDGNPQVTFKFDLEYKGTSSHFNTMELWTNYPITFMVSFEGGWTYFNWDGEKWYYEMKDQELAELVIDNLIIGYESKPENSSD